MKHFIFVFSFLIFSISVSAQTPCDTCVISQLPYSYGSPTEKKVLGKTGKDTLTGNAEHRAMWTRLLRKIDVQKALTQAQIDNTNSVIALKANITSVDTAKAAIRTEISNSKSKASVGFGAIKVDSTGGKYLVSLNQNSVEESHLQNNSVVTDKIQDRSVLGVKIGLGEINGPLISKAGAVNGSILQFDADPSQNTWRTLSPSASVYSTKQGVIDSSSQIRTDLQNSINSVISNTDAVYQKKVALLTGNNIIYVSKKWTTKGDADYNAQSLAATVGSPVATFHTLDTARMVAAKLLYNKTVERITIIVSEGTIFTAAQVDDNVSADWIYRNTATNTRYHPYPSTTTVTYDDSLCLSLFYPNLIWEFKKGSGIRHLSGKGGIVMAWDTTAIQSVRGLGNFDYSLNNTDNNNRNVMFMGGKGLTEFECDSLTIKTLGTTGYGWGHLELNSTGSNIVKANYLGTWDGNFLLRTMRNSNIKIATLKIDSTLQKNQEVGYVIGSLYSGKGNTAIEIENLTLGSCSFAYLGTDWIDVNLDIKVKNIKQQYIFGNARNSDIANSTNTTENALIQMHYFNTTNGWLRSNLNVQIGSYRGQMPALCTNYDPLKLKNSILNFDFGNFYQDSMTISGMGNKVTIDVRSTNSDSSLFAIKGNFLVNKESVAKIASNGKYSLVGTMKTLSTSISPLTITGDNSNTKIGAQISVDGSQNSVSGTGTITMLPSATANTAAAGTVTTNGTFSVNSNYKQ